MPTHCNQECFAFHPLLGREVRGQFDGGASTSDGGGLLLREVGKRTKHIGLFADRASTALLRSNPVRLYFSAVAYLLLQALRRLGLQGTALAHAPCATLRLKLLKSGARIRITVRQVWVSLASGSPYAGLFAQVYANLQQVTVWRCGPPPATHLQTLPPSPLAPSRGARNGEKSGPEQSLPHPLRRGGTPNPPLHQPSTALLPSADPDRALCSPPNDSGASLVRNPG